jgi:DNA polymerase-3 subunit epsilon
MNFIAVDFETANNERSSICSVGFAMVENGKLVGSEHIYIKPIPNYYLPYNTIIHGIDDSHTRNKESFEQQWKHLEKYFNNQTIVAHNASFDCSALRSALDASKLTYPNADYHCTYRLAKECLPLSGHGLAEITKHFKIELTHHNAESDARASALIALKLCAKYQVNSLEELSTRLGFKVGKIIGKTKSYSPFSKR